MSAAPPHRLSRDELLALKFAAHRQLARWAKSSQLRYGVELRAVENG